MHINKNKDPRNFKNFIVPSVAISALCSPFTLSKPNILGISVIESIHDLCVVVAVESNNPPIFIYINEILFSLKIVYDK